MGAVAAICGVAVQESTDFSLQIPGVALLFATCLGIALHDSAPRPGPWTEVHVHGQWSLRDRGPDRADGRAQVIRGPLLLSTLFLGCAWPALAQPAEPPSRVEAAVGLMWMGPKGISLGFGYVNSGRSSKNTFFIGVGFPIGCPL